MNVVARLEFEPAYLATLPLALPLAFSCLRVRYRIWHDHNISTNIRKILVDNTKIPYLINCKKKKKIQIEAIRIRADSQHLTKSLLIGDQQYLNASDTDAEFYSRHDL